MGADEFSILRILWLAKLYNREPKVCLIAPSSSRKQLDVIQRNKGRGEKREQLGTLFPGDLHQERQSE